MYIDETQVLRYQHQNSVEQERFASMFGLRSAFMQETSKLPWLTPDLVAKLNKVQGQTVSVPAIKKDTITTASVMSYDVPLNLPETAYTSLTMVNLSVGYGMYPEDHENGTVSREVIEQNRIKECDEALAKALENLLDTHLDTYKSAVWDGADSDMGYSFDTGDDVLEISKDAQFNQSMFAELQTMANINNWDGDNAIFVANHGAGFIYNKIAQLGAGNAKNLQFQNLPQAFFSSRVTNSSSDDRWTGYLVEPGSVGIVPNYTLPFRQQKQGIPGTAYGITAGALPMLGDRVMMLQQQQQASSRNGNVSWVESTAFFYNFFLLKKYNSAPTTTVGNILKMDAKKV